MYALIHGLLSDRKGEVIFTCFGLWHFCYMLAVLAAIVLVLLWVKGRGQEAREKAAPVFIHIAFGLYIADFFLMPFAYEQIDIEKMRSTCAPPCACYAFEAACRFSGEIPVQLRLLALSPISSISISRRVMWYGVQPPLLALYRH
jgi:hypothetical protein